MTKMIVAKEYLNDPHFADTLLALLVSDREFCRDLWDSLKPEALFESSDPKDNTGRYRLMVAKKAKDFWRRYRQPIGKMLKVELVDMMNELAREGSRNSAAGFSPAARQNLLDYADDLLAHKNGNGSPPAAVMKKVLDWMSYTVLKDTLAKLNNLNLDGILSMDDFLKLARDAADSCRIGDGRPTSIFSELEFENRIARRDLQVSRVRFPALLIDPIDRMIRIIARKHLGLILAPYKRGKTMFFVWLALAYIMQGYNVLHFTLEDPKEDIEDRFDAAITSLPMSRLSENPDRVRARFHRFKKYARTKLKVQEGTDGDMSVGKMESIFERERNRGFTADVVLVDYDDEIQPREHKKERRMEFADIYRDYRAFLSRHELIGWTASQTTRKSEDMKIIGGKETAEDISKMRKSSFVISIGKGDWGDDSVFLWVPAHRYDRMHVGANIITDKERSLFYDRDKTIQREKQELAKKEMTE